MDRSNMHISWLLILVVGFFACASGCSSPGEEQKSNKLVSVKDLPPRYAEAWHAFTRDTEEWPALRESVRDDPKLARFFVDNLVRVVIKSYERSSIASAGQTGGAFERSSRELLYLRESSGPVLVELLMVGDSVVSFIAGDLLLQMDEGRWSVAVSRKLANEDPEERRRAAELLMKLPLAGDGEDEIFEHLEVALADSSWAVRAQTCLTLAARSLARGRVDLARGPLSRALADEERSVVQTACEALRRTRDRGAVPALINLLERLERESNDIGSMRACQRALLAATGEEEEKRVAAWRAWWHDNR